MGKDFPDCQRYRYQDDSHGLSLGLRLFSEEKKRGEKIIKKGYVRSRGVKIKCHFLTAVSENGGAGEV